MSDLSVTPVRSWSDQRRFIDLPWDLYRDDPHWMPPLRGNQAELLGYKKHPFYDDAECLTFLARRQGRVVGRIAAIVNHAYLKRYQDQPDLHGGFFGFFESIDDPAVATALFDEARAWLASRGCHRVFGPSNPSMNYECGLLVAGFDSPPTFMMTYNPPYYERLLLDYGFVQAHEMYAYVGLKSQLPGVAEKLAPLAEQARRFCEVDIRPVQSKTFSADVEAFVGLYNGSLDVNWGFVPLSDGEMRNMVKSLKMLIRPSLTMAAFNSGRMVGAVVGLPDYNPRIKAINGRLFPFGFIKLLWGRDPIRRIRVVSINVLKEYHRWGLGIVLLGQLVPEAIRIGVDEAEFSWVSHDNRLARQGLEKGGARISKTYRMYVKHPDGA